jgi:hypothetical protein
MSAGEISEVFLRILRKEYFMMKGKIAVFSFAALIWGMQVQASIKCDLEGSYGYVYDGVSYDGGGPGVEIAETGSFSVGSESCGANELCGTAKATFRFPDFGGVGPVWVLLQLDFVGETGAVAVDPFYPCQGTIDFLATGTVIKASPEVLPPEFVLFTNAERSIAYTVSGVKEQIVDLISTSPGSVLAGTAKQQDE